MSTTDTPKLTTGHPAKDSGGGMMLDAQSAIREVMDTLVAMGIWREWRTPTERAHARWTKTREYRRSYARHWELEGPRGFERKP